MGEYGGESNAKKIARAYFWLIIERGTPSVDDYRDDDGNLGDDQRDLIVRDFNDKDKRKFVLEGLPYVDGSLPGLFEYLPVAVLSGPMGFDVQTLLAMGVLPHVITAIDTNPESIESAKSRINGFMSKGVKDFDAYYGHTADCISWVCDDYAHVLRSQGFAIVFMDTCSPILHAAKHTIDAVALSAQMSPLRHEGKDGECPQRRAQVFFGGMYGRDGRFMPERQFEHKDSDARRTVRLFEKFGSLATAAGAYFQPSLSISYTSLRPGPNGKAVGTPMLYAGGALTTVEGAYNWGAAHRKRMRMKLDAINVGLIRDFCREPSNFIRVGHDLGGAKLKQAALDLGADEYASDVLGVPRGTVRAWKAHDTRGTYQSGI